MQIALDGVPGVRVPIRFSEAQLALHRPAPKLGEDDPA
jgi:crotonobetainyl-CoA:carnitine CoA-transferase CaiB-like acyl-CoA transferase